MREGKLGSHGTNDKSSANAVSFSALPKRTQKHTRGWQKEAATTRISHEGDTQQTLKHASATSWLRQTRDDTEEEMKGGGEIARQKSVDQPMREK